MSTLTSKISFAINALFRSDVDVGSINYPVNFNQVFNLANGVGADQAAVIWSDTRTLTASNNEDLDLSGSETDAFGASLALTKLKAILVVADANNTNNVEVSRPASNGVPFFMAASDAVALTPGAAIMMTFPDLAGVAVTAGTGDLINFANSAGGSSVNYTVIFIGV